ncbi:MAG: protein kinase [Muribaculaceae bacterium]|nr:protein kinase [Muribaculaceae bacterium]
MKLKINTELQSGKYRIICVLGQGGFGITYLAENTYFEKKVAIKEFFPKDFCGRDNTSHLTLGTQNNAETVAKLKARFLKEAKNIFKLDHPGIVKILDIFEENNTAYYVMDFIEGENLNEIVKNNGPLSEEIAVEYIKKVGEALEYIHSRNMTHFDVKPANIVIRKSDDMPILIDFGLSKQYTSKGDATFTLLQGVSRGYSPIELYNPGSLTSFSPQTDVYSLGATLYFLITGKIPPSASDISQNGISIPNSISSNISQVIENSMETKRLKRYSTISSFLSVLDSSDKDSNGIKRLSRVRQIGIIIMSVILLGIIVPFMIPKRKSKTISTLNGYLNGYEWIDLGLPSGLKWATYNIGAASPYGTGDHFAWGETDTKPEFTNQSIMFGKNRPQLYSEGIVDSKGVLKKQYDVANIKWGASWRIPTKAEWEELSTKCIWNPTTYNGVKGYEATGPNGNTIFFPATGHDGNNTGERGFYWSSSDDGESQLAYEWQFGTGGQSVWWASRYCGYAVRPVTE